VSSYNLSYLVIDIGICFFTFGRDGVCRNSRGYKRFRARGQTSDLIKPV
jgi:hypothetical protein